MAIKVRYKIQPGWYVCILHKYKNVLNHTCTFSSGDKRWAWLTSATFSRSGQKNTDLIFCIRVQMPQLISWCIYSMSFCPGPSCHMVFHFFQDNRSISNNGISIQLYQQISWSNSKQLWGCYWSRWFCKTQCKPEIRIITTQNTSIIQDLKDL